MSNRELAMQMLNSIPESKVGYVMAYLQGLMVDDSADDAFCEALFRQYENDPDKGNFVGLEDAAKQMGVSLQ